MRQAHIVYLMQLCFFNFLLGFSGTGISTEKSGSVSPQSYFSLLKQRQEQDKGKEINSNNIEKKEKIENKKDVHEKTFSNSNNISIDTLSYLARSFEDKQLNSKKISINSGEAKIQDIIELVGHGANINFVIDSDVKGSIAKSSFKDVTPGYILNFILTHNDPPLALVKDLNVWRIMLRTRAEEFIKITEQNALNITFKIFDINYATMNDKFKDLIEKVWNTIVSDKKYISSITLDSERKKIFIHGCSKNIDEFTKFLKNIDKPVTQIRIDAIIVFAQKNFNFDFGINWSGIYNRQCSIQLNKTPFGFSGVGGRLDDFPEPTKSIDERHGDLYVNPENFAINLFTRAFKTPQLSDHAHIHNNTFIKIPFVFGGPDLNLRRLNLLLNAAESESKVKIVSRPSIMTSDNEVAKILIGAAIPIQATAVDILAVAVQNITSINYKDIGIALEVHPVVSPDKQTIKLEIFIEESEVVSGTTFTNERGIMTNPPVIDIIKIHNKVSLQNGQTVVIGGLASCDERNGKNKVPFLHRIPFIGKWFFTADSEFKKEFEQFIFITPTIIDCECDDSFEQLEKLIPPT